MGNAISGLPPLSVATSIIGIISFVFTLLTALRVFWQNLRTLATADTEVRTMLPNLKQALHEERTLLRLTRRRCRGQYEEGAFRILADSVRDMLSQFRRLEAPFIDHEGSSQSLSSSSAVGGGKHRGGNGSLGGLRGEREKAREFSMEMGGRARMRRGGGADRDRDWSDEEAGRRAAGGVGGGRNGSPGGAADDYYGVRFRAVSLWQKWAWLLRRSDMMDLAGRLARVQERRMARQTTDICIDTRYVAGVIAELQERIERLEGRGLRGGRGAMD